MSSFHLEKPHSEGKWQLVPGMQTCPLCWHGQDTCWSFVNKSSVFRIPHLVLVVLLVADFSAIGKCIWWVKAAQPYRVTGTGGKPRKWGGAWPHSTTHGHKNGTKYHCLSPGCQQTANSWCKALSDRPVQKVPDRNTGTLSSFYKNCSAPFPSPSAVTDDSIPPKLEEHVGQVTKVLPGLSPPRRGARCSELVGAGDACGFSPDRNMWVLISFLLSAPSKRAWRGSILADAQLHHEPEQPGYPG